MNYEQDKNQIILILNEMHKILILMRISQYLTANFVSYNYRGSDKSLARPGRKKTTAQEF